MFVIDATPGWQFWNRKHPRFEKCVYDDIEKMVRRDRSRPSLFLWEPILNETHFPADFTTNAVATVKRNALPPNDACACDLQSKGSGICDIQYIHRALSGHIGFRREWGDYVDNWNAQNSPSRVLREWGEVAMVRQAHHYMKFIDELKAQSASHHGGCLWHGTDHARGYHPDNFYGGILTYARQKKYSWYAFKAALTDKPFVFVAHELSPYSPSEFAVFANCPYTATLMGKPFTPGKTAFDYRERQNILWKRKKAPRSETDKLLNFTATLQDGSKVTQMPARRLVKIDLALDTEGLAPVADGGDLVACVATLADDIGTPKRYETETIRFIVQGEADIVGTNPQVTRWGEAVVLIRPRAAASPGSIVVRAETLRKGKYAPMSGVIAFKPGSVDVAALSPQRATSAANDARLRQVEAQQQEFEAKE
jgi:beta-galactosidase